MKQKLLFIIPSMSAGGGEKSLANLLNEIDFERFDVDLFLLHHDGLFMDLLPNQVRIISLPDRYHVFTAPLLTSVFRFLTAGQWKLAYYRMMFSLINHIVRHPAKREQYSWRYLSFFLEPLSTPYDVAIGFLEKTSIYYCVEKVLAGKKWGWVHIDYDEMGMDANFDLPYFKRLDVIATVSEECAQVLRRRFPHESQKVKVIYNIVSETFVQDMAEKKTEDIDEMTDCISLLSIGRLHPQKGYEMAIEACRILVDRGHDIKWFVIGEGQERSKLERLIKEHRLEQHFKLLGLRTNPYPYIKQATVYVQTSRMEGKSIALDEAKILHKPIVVTNYRTASDQIRHEVDGLIVPMDAKGIANGIERLIRDGVLRARLTRELSMMKLGTEHEIAKLYSLIEQAEEVS